MESIDFLELSDVMQIHINQIANYGGANDIRDANLLESAIEQPRATYDGSYLHTFPFEMAAAYLFHIVMNHPFVDGNKRTGTAAALVNVRSPRSLSRIERIESITVCSPRVASYCAHHSRLSLRE